MCPSEILFCKDELEQAAIILAGCSEKLFQRIHLMKVMRYYLRAFPIFIFLFLFLHC